MTRMGSIMKENTYTFAKGDEVVSCYALPYKAGTTKERIKVMYYK